MRTPLLILAAIMLVTGAVPVVAAETGKTAMQFNFADMQFQHRWSSKNQNEFTPKAQTDLNHWTDMVTINVYDSVHNGEELAAAANAVLGNYQANGKILRTDSKARTEQHPAEHFIAAVLGTPQFLEAVFTRLLLVDGRDGCAVVYSHRVYGEKVGPQMSKWLADYAAEREKALMSWEQIPPVGELKALPQSK